jgi:hypothetical protein
MGRDYWTTVVGLGRRSRSDHDIRPLAVGHTTTQP